MDCWLCRNEHPFISISGNIENEAEPCNGPTITLGTKSSCHYQSLLPLEMLHLRRISVNDVSGEYNMQKSANPENFKMPDSKTSQKIA